jgi:predicted DCC family thiol-disulfide oxidoreductase YuxK
MLTYFKVNCYRILTYNFNQALTIEMQTKSKIIFFDGDCLLCNRFARIIFKLNRNKEIRFASLDGKTAEMFFAINFLGNIENTVVYYRDGMFFYKSTAVIEIFYDVNFLLKISKIFYLVPQAMRDFLYDFTARNRNKIFRKNNNCKLINNLNKNVLLD